MTFSAFFGLYCPSKVLGVDPSCQDARVPYGTNRSNVYSENWLVRLLCLNWFLLPKFSTKLADMVTALLFSKLRSVTFK